ncbi:MAG TPA: HNH endonuclease signature motif containing protein [Anaerolineales bacterium]|nr:HNH endonuclease signature motif containing protein [Anaerolineales bacterium]
MSVLKRCQVCNGLVMLRPALIERKRYCSKACARKGWKGQHRSRQTEFKPGSRPQNWVPVGSEAIRKGNLCWIKVCEPNVWRSRSHLVWEKHHRRTLPAGWIVRHRNGDSLDDRAANLEAMPRSENLARTMEDPEILERKKKHAGAAQRARWRTYRESKFDGYYWDGR